MNRAAARILGLALIANVAIVSRSEDIKGYNAYNPKGGKAQGAPTNDPNNFDDVFPTPTKGSSSQRAAYAAASNCFKKGGGEVPEYYICRSDGDYAGHDQQYYCQTDEAQHCLDDLRFNRSRNVNHNCSYSVNKVRCTAPPDDDGHSVHADPDVGNCETTQVKKSGMQLLGQVRSHPQWRGCCPVMDKTLDVFEHSSAYPDALLCLQQAHCEHEQVFQDLVGECEERCCDEGACRYPLTHRDPKLAGALLPRYEGVGASFTAGQGPCAPSTPPGVNAAARLVKPGRSAFMVAVLVALSVAVA